MKRVIKAAIEKPNKQKLRSEFVRLATEIRDMSKYEFVELLKQNDFETAMSWIDKLTKLHDEFSEQLNNSINYLVAKVIVDDTPVGYVCKFEADSGSRGWLGRMNVWVTDNINEAIKFATIKEGQTKLTKGQDIRVYFNNSADDIAYEYEPGFTDRPEIMETKSDWDGRIFAGDIHYEYVEV